MTCWVRLKIPKTQSASVARVWSGRLGSNPDSVSYFLDDPGQWLLLFHASVSHLLKGGQDTITEGLL